MRKIIMYIVIALASFLLIINTYKLGVNSVKPITIVMVDSEELQKLQSQFNQLQVEYDTFDHYLRGVERGYFIGYMKAKGYEVEE